MFALGPSVSLVFLVSPVALPVDDYELVERKNEKDPVGTERPHSGSRNTSLNSSAKLAKVYYSLLIAFHARCG
jgi:hypothetical protein